MRHPLDGKPFYCKVCGLGLAEYWQCDDEDCELESCEDAQARKAKTAADAMTPVHGAP
jgi:hypothetical protein